MSPQTSLQAPVDFPYTRFQINQDPMVAFAVQRGTSKVDAQFEVSYYYKDQQSKRKTGELATVSWALCWLLDITGIAVDKIGCVVDTPNLRSTHRRGEHTAPKCKRKRPEDDSGVHSGEGDGTSTAEDDGATEEVATEGVATATGEVATATEAVATGEVATAEVTPATEEVYYRG